MKTHPLLLAAVTSKDPDVTASNFSFTTGFTMNTGFSSTGGNMFARVNGTSASTLSGAITDNDYVTVTITQKTGYPLNLTSLTVDLGYSLDGAATPDGIGVNLGISVFNECQEFAFSPSSENSPKGRTDEGEKGERTLSVRRSQSRSMRHHALRAFRPADVLEQFSEPRLVDIEGLALRHEIPQPSAREIRTEFPLVVFCIFHGANSRPPSVPFIRLDRQPRPRQYH